MTRSSAAPAGNRLQPPRERGFALLVIFLIAAAVAFTMYQELPRAAFESARDKEQLLMDRGNQYKRAIQVFYAVNKRYPAEIKDLENTNDKRFLRRRYIDPMTGQDEWRLIHTNGSFLTDSLVTKPPAQNAGNGLPGAGQTPGGGPLGANNLNTAPAAASVTNPPDPTAVASAQLNAAAQRRPSDRGFPTAPGFPQPPGAFNPATQNAAGTNPFGANPANFNPDDPSTWPPITLTPPAGQAGQPAPGLARPGQPSALQPQTQGVLGQLSGQGGANPQPAALSNSNPFAPNALAPAPVQISQAQNSPGQSPPTPNPFAPNPLVQTNGVPNSNPFSPNVDGQLTPAANQPAAVPQPQQLFGGQPLSTGQPLNGGQSMSASQLANLVAAGFNPQNPAPFLPGVSGQPSPALPGNNSGNPALNSIDNALFRPNQAPATGPTGSPGIAGVASTFKGPSIKAYHERTKYQEWEFVYEPAANQPGANQPGANQPGANQPGANQPGANQAGALGQNQQPNQSGLGQNGSVPGQTPAPASTNPFSQPNIFSPQGR